ncbi:MAG: adenine nucleotide alpha hydrolase [Bacteroidetes bacterium]|nr:adenine nucleotide alpha hydrolase [Bacteroidota bacterium]
MNKELLSYKKLIDGDIPPWVFRFIKHTGKAINRYSMIRDGDNVLLGISGGKDSLALALALSLRRKWLPISYNLDALHINWEEHPVPPEKIDQLAEYFSDLLIPFNSVTVKMHQESFKGEFNCYLCSRNRRRILFQTAAEKDYKIIALGHHLDDLVETSLINLCFRGNFSTMLPVQEFFKGKLYIIRPMIEIKEHLIKRLAVAYNLPVAKPVCPFDQTNIRSKLKPIIKDLCKVDKLTLEHIYNAHDFSCQIPRDVSLPHTDLLNSHSPKTE